MSQAATVTHRSVHKPVDKVLARALAGRATPVDFERAVERVLGPVGIVRR